MRHKRKLIALGVIVGAPLLFHFLVGPLTRLEPPDVRVPNEPQTSADDIVRIGSSYTRMRAGVREVYLEGEPEELGAYHARLLHDRMVEDEGALWNDFERFVPLSPARALMIDISRVKYRHVDQGIPDARRREIAAAAIAGQPDPYSSRMPTYERAVFLHAVYDIALSFEHSPLLGCSAFGLGSALSKDGHVRIGRAFDFEAGDVFDTDKTVFFVRETGRVPYASVSWPGMTGVLTGMNAFGVVVLVNGARAGEPRSNGMPVVFSLREALASAHDAQEAIKILSAQDVMVSHIVFVADGLGKFAVVERAPGFDAHVRDLGERAAVTNHLEGPLANDPKNQAVRANTTSVARRSRLDEMLGKLSPGSVDDEGAVAMLRDHECAAGEKCELGDRRTIDAFIATHGVIADATARVLWVSKGPHLSGEFVRFDLQEVFAHGHDPKADPPPKTIAADAVLNDGRYEAGRARAGGPKIGGDKK